MQAWIAVFALGTVLAGFLPVLPDRHLIAAGVILVLLLWRFLALRAVLIFLSGVIWLCIDARQHISQILPESLEQQDLWVRGNVTGLVQDNGTSTRFRFVPDSYCTQTLTDCSGWEAWPGQQFLLTNYSPENFTPGEARQLQVRLKQPHGSINPGSFDYERWLFVEGITATGYVRQISGQANQPLPVSYSPLHVIDRLRHHFLEHLDTMPLQVSELIKALTVGERGNINAAQWQVMTVTGTNHLLVISGLHLGLVAWGVFAAFRGLARFTPGLCLKIPAGKTATVPAMLAATAYALFAGLSLPVQRALVMVLVVLFAIGCRRQAKPLNTLSLALLLVLFIDPMAPQSPGFWLSFIAVSCLLLASTRTSPEQVSPWKWLSGSVRTQGYLLVGMAPLMLVMFQQLSLLAPLVNLLAIPLIGLLVVPLCLLGALMLWLHPDLGETLLGLADFLLEGFFRLLAFVAEKGDNLLLAFPAMPWLYIVALVMISTWLFIRSGWQPVILLLAFLVLGYRYKPEPIAEDELVIDILDVGQGLSILLSTHSHEILYDTGPRYSPRFNAGSGIILPFLNTLNRPFPDLIVLSHGDIDHSGGLPALISEYPDTPILAGEPVSGIKSRPCQAGQKWLWSGIQFEMLAPVDAGHQGNDASCVLLVTAGKYRLLLPGDIEGEAELALVRQYGQHLKADILIAPHHGSITSSLSPFVRHVSPRIVVYSSGYLNRFGHPHATIKARYDAIGALSLNTAATGHIRITMSANNGISEPVSYRQARRRFWSDYEGKVRVL